MLQYLQGMRKSIWCWIFTNRLALNVGEHFLEPFIDLFFDPLLTENQIVLQDFVHIPRKSLRFEVLPDFLKLFALLIVNKVLSASVKLTESGVLKIQKLQCEILLPVDCIAVLYLRDFPFVISKCTLCQTLLLYWEQVGQSLFQIKQRVFFKVQINEFQSDAHADRCSLREELLNVILAHYRPYLIGLFLTHLQVSIPVHDSHLTHALWLLNLIQGLFKNIARIPSLLANRLLNARITWHELDPQRYNLVRHYIHTLFFRVGFHSFIVEGR